MDIRKYYLQFIENGSDRSFLSKVSKETNLSEETIRSKLNYYDKTNSNIEEKLKYEKVKNSLMEKNKPVDNSKYYGLINKIRISKDPKEIIKLIEESEIKEEQKFASVVTSYVIAISKNNPVEIVSAISVKLNSAYDKYKQHINRENERIRLEKIFQKNLESKLAIRERNLSTIKFLKEIANSEFQTSNEYLIANKIPHTEYSYAIKLIEENEKEAFTEYSKIMVSKLKNQNLGKEDLLGLIEKIISGIDGRNFDLLDYYEHTKLSLYEMSKICSYGLDNENYRILKTFIGKNMIIEKFDIEREISSKYIITMNGSQKEPTNEDKYAAYQYLIDHNYPKDYKLYQIVLKRVIMNFDYTKTLIK